MKAITNPRKVKFESLTDLQLKLHTQGCRACSLGFQENLNGCCVARGCAGKQRMIIGEAPGKYEDAQSEPFVGPAGKLMDKIFESVGFDVNKDFHVTNVVLCRPIAVKGSGKENYTPRVKQQRTCRPYLDMQIGFIKPKLIVTLGKPATESILQLRNIRMGEYRGHQFKLPENGAVVFPMLHPAAILHASFQPEKYKLYREQTWADIQKLKQIVEKEDL